MIRLEHLQIGSGHCVIEQNVNNIACAKGKFSTLIGANGTGK